MRATEHQLIRAAQGLCLLLMTGGLLALCPATYADDITNFTVLNVTPTSFSVVWWATNSTPSISVFADSGGVTNLTGQVGLEAFPLNTGNPRLAEGYVRRVDAATLRQKTQSAGVMIMRVSDCQPNTTYYFRLTSTPASGSPEVYPVSGPLPSVTTETGNTFVVNDQVIILDLGDPNDEGRIVLLTHTNAAYPLGAVVGDGVGPSQVFFNVSDLFALAGTGNFTPLGDQDFTLDVLGPNGDVQSQSYTLTFTTGFSTATTMLVNVEFLALNVGSAVLRAGQAGTVSISGDASANLTGIDGTLQIPPGHLTNLVLQSLSPQLDPAATTFIQQNSSTWQLHLAALSGQTIFGSNALAEIAFTAISNQISAFVPLQVTALSGTNVNANYTPIIQTLGQSGQVVVIANQPLLHAGFAADGSRQLTLYGKPWMSYAIEYSTNLNNPAGWTLTRHFAQTNMVTSLIGLGPGAPNVFYRALEFMPDPPVLDAILGTNQTRTLLGYGQPGRQYTVLSKTNLSNVVPWTPVQTYTLTNSFQSLAVPGSNNIIFYRLQRN